MSNFLELIFGLDFHSWSLDILRALDHLHNRNPIIMHRDVKPGEPYQWTVGRVQHMYFPGRPFRYLADMSRSGLSQLYPHQGPQHAEAGRFRHVEENVPGGAVSGGGCVDLVQSPCKLFPVSLRRRTAIPIIPSADSHTNGRLSLGRWSIKDTPAPCDTWRQSSCSRRQVRTSGARLQCDRAPHTSYS